MNEKLGHSSSGSGSYGGLHGGGDGDLSDGGCANDAGNVLENCSQVPDSGLPMCQGDGRRIA